MEMLKRSLAMPIEDNIAMLKERERRAAEDRHVEREPGLEVPMNRAARRRAEKLARKQHA